MLIIKANLPHSIVTSLVWLQPVLAVLGQVLLSTKQESEYERIPKMEELVKFNYGQKKEVR